MKAEQASKQAIYLDVSLFSEAEQAVIGGILLDPSVLAKVIEILRPNAFIVAASTAFSIMMRMFTTAQTEDIITVIDESVTMGIFGNIRHGKNLFKRTYESVPSTANIESYCNIIKENIRFALLLMQQTILLKPQMKALLIHKLCFDSAEQKICDIRQGQ